MDSLNTILNSGTYGDSVSRHNDNYRKIQQVLTGIENVAFDNLTVRKSYTTLTLANADLNPVGDDGVLIKVGQLVAISGENKIYKLDSLAEGVPSWGYVGIVGDMSSKLDTGGFAGTAKTIDDETLHTYSPSIYDEFTVDEDGWVMDYAYNPYSLIMDFNAYGNDTFMVDSTGWVGEKTGYIREQPIPKDVFVKDQFSDAVIVKSEVSFLGFPAICADNNGILHAFWRKGSGHVSDDGSIMYSRSIDNGDTWIDEMVALPGHELVNGYYSDYRDSRAIFTRDGKVLHLTFRSWTNDGGATYDSTKTQLIATIFPLLNGKIDIVNKTEVIISDQVTDKGKASAGTLFYHKNEIYIAAYGQNESNLIKSADNGITWTFVGKIAANNNECAVSVVGDQLVAVARNSDGATSEFYESTDSGVTWAKIKDLNVLWHGMDAKGLSDCILITGRHKIDGTNYGYSFVLYDKFGNEVFPKFDIHNFAGNGDCAYGQICSFQRWVYFVYYNSLPSNSTIYFKRILRKEILGINY